MSWASAANAIQPTNPQAATTTPIYASVTGPTSSPIAEVPPKEPPSTRSHWTTPPTSVSTVPETAAVVRVPGRGEDRRSMYLGRRSLVSFPIHRLSDRYAEVAAAERSQQLVWESQLGTEAQQVEEIARSQVISSLPKIRSSTLPSLRVRNERKPDPRTTSGAARPEEKPATGTIRLIISQFVRTARLPCCIFRDWKTAPCVIRPIELHQSGERSPANKMQPLHTLPHPNGPDVPWRRRPPVLRATRPE